MFFLWVVFALAIPGGARAAEVASRSGSCHTALYRLALQRLVQFDAEDGAGYRRYPRGIDPAVAPDAHLQYGFESEYLISESEKLLDFYGPDPNHANPEWRMSNEQWLAMPLAERMQWVKDKLARKPTFAEESGLVRLARHNRGSLDFLPESLTLDPTGNLEIILPPVDTMERWYSQVRQINAAFGTGSMQAMITSPANVYFGKSAGETQSAAVEENLGYLNFIHDFDTIEKMEQGALRYRKDPTKRVMNPFTHPFLGPITRAKQDLLRTYLEANANGNLSDVERDLLRVRRKDDSFKYIGSTAYRPDIGMPQRRVAMEVRDTHKNAELLLSRVLRTTRELQEHGLAHRAFAKIQAFDSVADFEKFSPEVRQMLATLFPGRAPVADDSPAERLAVEVYRNFAYPLRDWTTHLQVFQKGELTARLARAQEKYRESLRAIAGEWRAQQLTNEAAAVRIQGHLAEFAVESGLAQAFQNWQRLHLTGDVHLNRYLNLVVRNLGPLKESFPTTLWEGTLDERLHRLAGRHGDRVARPEPKRLIVSTHGLGENARNAIARELLDAIGRGTVSFDGTALRLGTTSYRSAPEGNTAVPYEFPRDRWEPVTVLGPQEELRLRHRIAVALRDGARWGNLSTENGQPFLVYVSNRPLAELLRDPALTAPQSASR